VLVGQGGIAVGRFEFCSSRAPGASSRWLEGGLREMALILQRYDLISLRQWLLVLALTVVAVVISFYWLDRPIALFVHNQLPHGTRKVAQPLTYIPDPLVWIAAITFVVLGLVGLKGRSLSKMQSVLLVCSVIMNWCHGWTSLCIVPIWTHGRSLRGHLGFVDFLSAPPGDLFDNCTWPSWSAW